MGRVWGRAPHPASVLSLMQNGPVAVDMFLRTLNAVHEDVVSTEGSGYNPEVANRVKDGMRENCLPQIADAWYSILQVRDDKTSEAPRSGMFTREWPPASTRPRQPCYSHMTAT